jgi:hypothetical protein
VLPNRVATVSASVRAVFKSAKSDRFRFPSW